MTPLKGIVEIRTLDDINALYVIDPYCTLTKELYATPLRPYRLIQSEARCQYQKNGKRCSQLHQHGYIVERKDGLQVLIGNCCAFKHLGLDDEQVKGDFKQLTATERQNIRRHKVETLLKQRESFIERVRAANIEQRKLQEQVSQISSILPSPVVAILQDRWKRNSPEVSWEYLLVKVGVNEKGKRYEERHWYPHSYGQLRGLGLWLQLGEQRYPERLLDLRRQLEAIPIKERLTNAEIEQAEAALNQVSALSGIERELLSQAKILADFLTPPNLLLTIQLISNHKVRAETVTAVHRLIGEPCNSTPDKFVADIDLALKQQYSAGGIRIAS